MTYRTRQEIFDLAFIGLAKQGFEQSMTEDGCAYRGDDGLKCAIGHCIDDASYNKEMEGEAVGPCAPEILRAAKISEVDVAFAHELQVAHDMAFHGDTVKRNLIEFAKLHNLTIPEVKP